MKSIFSSTYMVPICIGFVLIFATWVAKTQLPLPGALVVALYAIGLALVFFNLLRLTTSAGDRWLARSAGSGVTDGPAAHEMPEWSAHEGSYADQQYADQHQPGWPAQCAGHPHRYAVHYTARFQGGPVSLERGLMYIARTAPICDPYDVATLADTIRNRLREEHPDGAIAVCVNHWIRFEDPVEPPGTREPVPDEAQRENVILFRAA